MRLVLYRGEWCAYWRDEAGRPRRRSLRTKNREAAQRVLVDLQNPSQTLTTVGEIVEAYLADKGVERARYAWKRLAPILGHLRPDQVNRATCRAYTAKRRRDGSQDGTIIKELSALRAALRWHDKHTPATIELPSEPPPKDLRLTREQYRALREAARKTPHIYTFVVAAYATAGRASAVLELTWDRIDFVAGVIRLGLGERRVKGRATVPMTDSAREVLAAAHRAAISDYVVEYAGQRVLSVKRGFAAAAARAGVPWCTPHVLRHTAAVHMAESGVPIEEIAQYLGHTSPSVTYRVYARYTPGYLRRAASALE